ncbi:hypothetical protein KY289_013537 [Solanum tuberosum]|nr:hypothetical protein KY289_013537 [Solanum tuberosum]
MPFVSSDHFSFKKLEKSVIKLMIFVSNDEDSDCLKYVHEDDMVHVSADYRRDVV